MVLGSFSSNTLNPLSSIYKIQAWQTLVQYNSLAWMSGFSELEHNACYYSTTLEILWHCISRSTKAELDTRKMSTSNSSSKRNAKYLLCVILQIWVQAFWTFIIHLFHKQNRLFIYNVVDNIWKLASANVTHASEFPKWRKLPQEKGENLKM